MQPEERQIRAVYDDQTITVYQAYHQAIAASAVQHQTFVSPPFKMDRMTWIKPSFLWMMYRCGWATKPNQEHVLAIRITRAGFDWALAHACLSHFDPHIHASEAAWKEELQHAPVRIQWDPERDIHLNKLDYRAIQIGLSGIAVQQYVQEWIVEVTDITAFCRKVYETSLHEPAAAQALIPVEVPYTPLP
ncbi:MAG: DUF4291 domain-containing protein [Bacteroidetes bacterium]|nr:MAG: DUF4291 domain-containing protein [Bacteroidota bacterium]PTM13952.1 MAG: DUF4291 domain-containing protein [Bacteroidota bacterium]